MATPWWRYVLVVLGLGWGLLLASTCHLPREATGPPTNSTSAVYLIQHGWHAGIAVRRRDLNKDGWSDLDNVPETRYLEVGWGEVDYYPARNRGTGTLLKAGLWPTGSTLHVVPVPTSVPNTFPDHTIVRIPVDSVGLAALNRYIEASFAEDPSALATGLHPGSRFYEADLSYHFFNNCNHWAAAALEAAGCDVRPRWTFTVGQVVEQAVQCGSIVQWHSTHR